MRTPPHNVDAEAGLIAACLLDPMEFVEVALRLGIRAESFFSPQHATFWAAIVDMQAAGKPIDEIALAEHLHARGKLEEVGGMAGIHAVTSRIETTVHAPHWAEIVRSKALLRRVLRLCAKASEEVYGGVEDADTFVASVEGELHALSSDRVIDGPEHISGPVKRATERIRALLARETSAMGLSTGLADLDAMTFGLHPSEMVVLAARPSVGKTALAMNIAEAAAMPRKGPATPTLVFSLEMSADALAMRMLCARARVDPRRVRDGFADAAERRALDRAAQETAQAPLHIVDGNGYTVHDLRAIARRAHRLHGIGLVVVDYLQLLAGSDPRAPREQQIAEISRGMKGMAKELLAPVLVLSQLNRESERERRDPRLSDLRESGSIEQDADVVMLLHRPKKSEEEDSLPGDVEPIRLIVAKQRNGPVGAIDLSFQRKFTRFENAAHDPNPKL